jgi:hypothetical protein
MSSTRACVGHGIPLRVHGRSLDDTPFRPARRPPAVASPGALRTCVPPPPPARRGPRGPDAAGARRPPRRGPAPGRCARWPRRALCRASMAAARRTANVGIRRAVPFEAAGGRAAASAASLRWAAATRARPDGVRRCGRPAGCAGARCAGAARRATEASSCAASAVTAAAATQARGEGVSRSRRMTARVRLAGLTSPRARSSTRTGRGGCVSWARRGSRVASRVSSAPTPTARAAAARTRQAMARGRGRRSSAVAGLPVCRCSPSALSGLEARRPRRDRAASVSIERQHGWRGSARSASSRQVRARRAARGRRRPEARAQGRVRLGGLVDLEEAGRRPGRGPPNAGRRGASNDAGADARGPRVSLRRCGGTVSHRAADLERDVERWRRWCPCGSA